MQDAGSVDHPHYAGQARAMPADMTASPRPSFAEGPEGGPEGKPDGTVETVMGDAAASEDELSAAAAAAAPASADDATSSIYGDQDDAQSFIQPAISPIATRLSSPKTPAVEKALAMDETINRHGAGYLDAHVPQRNNSSARSGDRTRVCNAGTPSAGRRTGAVAPVPPVAASVLSKMPPAARSSVFQSATRHARSSSVGSDALKRLSKAFPSLSFPNASTFLPSLSSPTSFFSSSSSAAPAAAAAAPAAASSPTPPPFLRTGSELDSPRRMLRGQTATDTAAVYKSDAGVMRPGIQRASSVASRPPSHGLRRPASDDSLLYHTLSRVSSQGDEEQFEHVREQVNSRVKAIMDSFDRPSFKLPQLPSFFPDGKGTTNASTTPREPVSPLDAVLESLTGDIVILGGYRGSILRSAEPPHRQLWVPVKVGLKIRKVNLEVGLDPEDEETMAQRIFPSGMLKHIGPVDISRRLFKKLRECDNARNGTLRVHDYGYDWRLSPHRLSRDLVAFLETLPCNDPTVRPPQSPQSPQSPHERGALVIAHSLGGSITRHAVNQRPELFSGVVFAGTPQRCVNILGPLRNGDAVLLNEKVLTAQVHFSLRTTFAFLPDDGFCFVNTKDPSVEYRVDFFDVRDWIRYRWSPCIGPPPLPPFQPANQASRRSSSTFGALLEDLSGSLPSLPLRGRNNSSSQTQVADGTTLSSSLSSSSSLLPPPPAPAPAAAAAAATVALAKDRLLAPQMDAPGPMSSAAPPSSPSLPSSRSKEGNNTTSISTTQPTPPPQPPAAPPAAAAAEPSDPQRARAFAYLTRTLAETKQFRAELAHRPEHTAANAYPPLAAIIGKGVPTVYAARVGSRAAIACADAYDDLVFRTGDGVVLAREAMLPAGYHYVRNGYVTTDRGHVGMLGDLNAVGKALQAVIRGRAKGIGTGRQRGDDAVTSAKAEDTSTDAYASSD
ncbi:hypothetical protein SPI_00333 [Niveomyces insectorum RCEF 264]|uniref:Phosphatidylcholine-sterol O-acyltransferase-like protein n=1 Tax=Niveomyces insectorum RCEF 264 TaxID=1081102 RepID=A0A168A1S3_9HYPO|nr:hypothetical protein SPI_00333 [Niveomyces insectorum RCEF 264]